MQSELDIFASAIHDAKNQLFFAESAAANLEFERGIDMSQIRGAIEQASNRLVRALAFYRVMRDGVGLSILPVPVSSLLEDGLAACQAQIDGLGIDVEVNCECHDIWPLDRDLVIDMITNATQNAARHARQRVKVSARVEDGMLVLRVEDDGKGFATLDESEIHKRGIGLYVAQRIAALHRRRDRCGEVRLRNHGSLGGAVFELCLP